MTLPSVYEVRRWRVTWVGFDAPRGVRLSAVLVLAACVELPPAFYPIRRGDGDALAGAVAHRQDRRRQQQQATGPPGRLNSPRPPAEETT
ncbi:hypothetical protein ACFY1B_47710 [Streptomyces mirabilis]|uniref:hypothetical protein n=1 Tax=Streptomyces mirabilis TaxID=68239 RepID=UPI00368699D3